MQISILWQFDGDKLQLFVGQVNPAEPFDNPGSFGAWAFRFWRLGRLLILWRKFNIFSFHESQVGGLEWHVFFEAALHHAGHRVAELEVLVADMAGKVELKRAGR